MAKLIKHSMANHTCNLAGGSGVGVGHGGLENLSNPMAGLRGWGLAAASIQDAGCCVSAPHGSKLPSLSTLHPPPWRECFRCTDNRPYRANSLIPDPSTQTAQIPPGGAVAPGNLSIRTMWQNLRKINSTCYCSVLYVHIPDRATWLKLTII